MVDGEPGSPQCVRNRFRERQVILYQQDTHMNSLDVTSARHPS